MAENEQFVPARLDDIRRELDSKIERKISTAVFFSVLSIISILVAGILGAIYYGQARIGDKVDDLGKRVTVIETKIDLQKK